MHNDLLVRCLSEDEISRPPVWIMRQAGRILPEYRNLRKQFPNFKKFIKTPDAVAEATLQPLDILDVDACILFSDILVIPEAMGCDYDLVEKKGPLFRNTISDGPSIDALLSGEEAANRIDYVYRAIESTLSAIENRVPLIGFSGAPWTLFAYMVEGQGSKTFSKARKFLRSEPELAHMALDKITNTVIAYLRRKIDKGIHVVQLFDSWAGVLNKDLFIEFCLPYLNRIREELRDAKMIYFPKDGWYALESLKEINFDVISLDWTITPGYARMIFGNGQILQGNMDPSVLYADDSIISTESLGIMSGFGRNHIFNLGHGVYPDIDKDKVKHLVQCIKEYEYPKS